MKSLTKAQEKKKNIIFFIKQNFKQGAAVYHGIATVKIRIESEASDYDKGNFPLKATVVGKPVFQTIKNAPEAHKNLEEDFKKSVQNEIKSVIAQLNKANVNLTEKQLDEIDTAIYEEEAKEHTVYYPIQLQWFKQTLKRNLAVVAKPGMKIFFDRPLGD